MRELEGVNLPVVITTGGHGIQDPTKVLKGERHSAIVQANQEEVCKCFSASQQQQSIGSPGQSKGEISEYSQRLVRCKDKILAQP